MCLKLSMANTGRSFVCLPMWCSGCANWIPSAVKNVTDSKPTKHHSAKRTLHIKLICYFKCHLLTFLLVKVFLNNFGEPTGRFGILRFVEQNQKRNSLFCELLKHAKHFTLACAHTCSDSDSNVSIIVKLYGEHIK